VQIEQLIRLSARQFCDPMLLPKLTGVVLQSGLESSGLELEITESTVMTNGEYAVEVLRNLKTLGVQISMDDFGTGYSSLAYLKRFPIDTIKIDSSFIRDVPDDIEGNKITRAIIAMAHSLKLKVVAEGVESERQLKFLRTQRCDEVQGYYYFKPTPASAVEAAIEHHLQEHAASAAA
jgi:EAL domain-containing protein (putative c-di-GMP-specific phosphodiesterase class I)